MKLSKTLPATQSERLQLILDSKLIVSHGKTTHSVNDPCESCKEAKGEWDVVEELLKDQEQKLRADLVERIEGMKKNKGLTCYCDSSGSDLGGFCDCEFTRDATLDDIISIIEEEV